MKNDMNSTADLRRLLFDTIADLRSGKIDHNRANAVSKLSGEILKSSKLDLEIIVAAKRLGSTVSPATLLVQPTTGRIGVEEAEVAAAPETGEDDPEAGDMEHMGDEDTLLFHFLSELPQAEREIVKNTRCKTARDLSEYGAAGIKKQLGANAKTAHHIGKWLHDKFGLTLAE